MCRPAPSSRVHSGATPGGRGLSSVSETLDETVLLAVAFYRFIFCGQSVTDRSTKSQPRQYRKRAHSPHDKKHRIWQSLKLKSFPMLAWRSKSSPTDESRHMVSLTKKKKSFLLSLTNVSYCWRLFILPVLLDKIKMYADCFIPSSSSRNEK